MVADQRAEYLSRARLLLQTMAEPIYRASSLPVDGWSWLSDHLADRKLLLEEVGALKAERLKDSYQLRQLKAVTEENQRLRSLLSIADHLPAGVQVALIMEVDLDPYTQLVLLDKGLADGVFEGQPLLSATGIMGQVVRVGPGTSRAMLITDPNHALPVKIERTGFQTIAYGTGLADQISLSDLPPSVDIQVGDTVLTSGLGKRFPAGFEVATVIDFEHAPGATFALARARPTAALNSIREVLLAGPMPGTELASP